MPFIVAYPVVSFLRRRAYTKNGGDCTAKKSDAIPPRNVHSITWSARPTSESGKVTPPSSAAASLPQVQPAEKVTQPCPSWCAEQRLGPFLFLARKHHLPAPILRCRW